MALLLDTHVFLWWCIDEPALSDNARSAITERGSTVFVSAATTWEIALKRAKGKLEVDAPIAELVEQSGFTQLPIEMTHTIAGADLPQHHRDPFDRLLVAQAQLEGLTLVTADAAIRRYDVATLDASS